MKLVRLSELRHTPDIQKLVERWLSGVSVNTRHAYSQDIKAMAAWDPNAVRAVVLGSAAEANAAVLDYKAHMINSPDIQANTINRRLASTRSLVKMAKLIGLCSHDIVIKNVRSTPYRDTSGPGKQAVLDMLKRAKRSRDRALLVLLFNNALRRGEAVAMDIRDVDFSRSLLRIVGKGHTEPQLVKASDQTLEALERMLNDPKNGHPCPSPGAPLFVALDNSSRGRRLSGKSVCNLVNRLGKSVGVRATPHGIRHTSITTALDETGGDIRSVAKFGRWANERVIDIYDDFRDSGQITNTISISSNS